MKIDETHFSQLCLLTPAELRNYSRRVASLTELLHNAPVLQMPTPQPEEPPQSVVETIHLPQRVPMRAPKPDSLRGAVHAVLLRARKPMRRAEVVEAVALDRGVEVTEVLTAKVGNLLCNRHDRAIEKHAHGVYALAPKLMEGPACL